MKLGLSLLTICFITILSLEARADTPVFSANGFQCGKKGVTVTCKGPMPDGKGTITGTGHNVVYLTVNTTTAGAPARYTYFSDTGCLVGYAFNAAGNPVQAVASHRSGAKQTFDFSQGKYDPLLTFCSEKQLAQGNPPTETSTSSAAPPKAEAKTAN